MITGILLKLLLAVITYLINWLPDATPLPAAFASGVTTVWAYVNAFSFLIPMNALTVCLSIALVFHGAIIGFQSLHWIIGKLRGSH